METNKTCLSCQKSKPNSEFKTRKRKTYATTSNTCKECERAKARARYSENRDFHLERHKRYHKEVRSGLGPGGYDRLLLSQGGGCAICSRLEPGGGAEAFSIDHDHTCCPGTYSCGRCVRGLLCVSCNNGLGRFMDSPETLRSAADYLERHSKE